MLDLGPRGQSAGETGDGDVGELVADDILDRQARGIAIEVGIGAQDDFLDHAVLQPLDQAVERDVAFIGSFQRGDPAEKDMVDALVKPRGFERQQIVASTASDWRAARNERAAIRRALRQMGVLS